MDDCLHAVGWCHCEPRVASEPERCPPSRRADGKHSWAFDGDDPRVICAFCGEVRDALSGRVVRPAPLVDGEQGDE